MKRQKQQGVILLCTLAIMVILSILLMVGVHRMQTSTMMTKRAIWEIKSYWAARAGNTIVADGCINSVLWPDEALISQAGGYTIGLSPDKNCVIGVDNNSGSSFNIYFINKILESYTRKSSNVEATLQKNFDKFDGKLPVGEFYALTAGKSGASVVGLELIYNIGSNPYLFHNTTIKQGNLQANQASSASACIYVAKNIFASISGTFSVSAKGNTRPAMVVGGVTRIDGAGGEPSSYGSGPLDMDEGSLFSNSATLNGTTITPKNTNKNLINYGLNVYSSFEVEGLDTPKYNESGATVPSGTFCLIEMPKYEKGYQKNEYEAAISSIMNTYLSPKDFWDIYGDSVSSAIDNANWSQQDLQDKGEQIDNNKNLELYPSYVGCNSSFNAEYEHICSNGFNSIIWGEAVQDQIEYDNKSILGKILDKVDEATGNKITNADIAIFVEKLYKAYLRNAVNEFVKNYRVYDNKYESFFVPDGNGISGSLEGKTFDVSYEKFTQARVLGVLGEYVGDVANMGMTGEMPGAPSNLSSLIGGGQYESQMNVFKKLGITELESCFAKEGEIDKIRSNYYKFLDNNPSSYIADKVKLSETGDMYLLDTITQHKNKDVINKFSVSKTRIGFDTDKLQVKLKGNLTSDGYFNYGAFKRDGNRYTQEEKDNLGILLNGNSLTVKNDIDIKGYVYGGGSIKANNICFEASGTNMMNGEADISLLSDNNIRILRNNGGGGEGIKINGVLWAESGNVKIDPGGGEDIFIQGSLICKNGGLTLVNARNFDIVYDPSKSRIVVKNTEKTNWWKYIESGENMGWNTDEELWKKSVETGDGVVNTGTFKLFNRI